MITKSQTAAADVKALLQARNPLIIVITPEEARVERYLIGAAVAANYVPRTWDVGQGIADMSGKVEQAGLGPDDTLDVIANAAQNTARPQRGVWIMRDMMPWLSGNIGMVTQRKLRNLARSLPNAPLDSAQAIIILSAGGDIPAELLAHATVVTWPLPDREEIAAILDATIDTLPDDMKATAAPNGNRDAAIDAAIGLSGEEAAACYASSLVKLKKIDPAVVSKEKQRSIARGGVLEWMDPLPGGLDWVGGLENLKAWLIARAAAYTPAAREYGISPPRGVMAIGISGCGKTLLAKACASARGCPLLRLDVNGLKSKYVGESEGNLRKALAQIEATGPCVVLIDEIEKAMQGATSGSADGGVSADALGTILSWMQDRQGEAFVIATANDVTALPPELLRKGRFDELFFIDLPNDVERVAVLQAAMKQYKRDLTKADVDMAVMATKTKGYTGSEIASLVPEAMFTAFADGGREINTSDLIKATETVVPLSKTAAEKIAGLRKWGKERARPASAQVEEETTANVRKLDIA